MPIYSARKIDKLPVYNQLSRIAFSITQTFKSQPLVFALTKFAASKLVLWDLPVSLPSLPTIEISPTSAFVKSQCFKFAPVRLVPIITASHRLASKTSVQQRSARIKLHAFNCAPLNFASRIWMPERSSPLRSLYERSKPSILPRCPSAPFVEIHFW